MTQQSYLKNILEFPMRKIQNAIQKKPRKGLFIFSLICGMVNLFPAMQSVSLGLQPGFALFFSLSLLLAPLFGVAFILLEALVIWALARFAGSKAKYTHYRAVVTWSMLPLTILALIWWIALFAKGAEQFINMDSADSLQNGHIVAVIKGWWTSFAIMQGEVSSKIGIGIIFLLGLWKLWIVSSAIETMEKWSQKKSVIVAVAAFVVFALFATKGGLFNVTFN